MGRKKTPPTVSNDAPVGVYLAQRTPPSDHEFAWLYATSSSWRPLIYWATKRFALTKDSNGREANTRGFALAWNDEFDRYGIFERSDEHAVLPLPQGWRLLLSARPNIFKEGSSTAGRVSNQGASSWVSTVPQTLQEKWRIPAQQISRSINVGEQLVSPKMIEGIKISPVIMTRKTIPEYDVSQKTSKEDIARQYFGV